jgi:hypothetical protein
MIDIQFHHDNNQSIVKMRKVCSPFLIFRLFSSVYDFDFLEFFDSHEQEEIVNYVISIV